MARRLDEIEGKKAKQRMSDGGKGVENSPQVGKARDAVAEQVGISSNTIAREKKIIEHKDEIEQKYAKERQNLGQNSDEGGRADEETVKPFFSFYSLTLC